MALIAVVDDLQIVWPEGMPLPGKGDVINLGVNRERIVDGMTFFPNEDPPVVRIETVLPVDQWDSAVAYAAKQERRAQKGWKKLPKIPKVNVDA